MVVHADGQVLRIVTGLLDRYPGIADGRLGTVIDQGSTGVHRPVRAQEVVITEHHAEGVLVAGIDVGKANLDRALKLVERGFISRADIDRLTATRDWAEQWFATAIVLEPLVGEEVGAEQIADVVEAWRSHATLERQAGASFHEVIAAIDDYLKSLQTPSIQIPYSTNIWVAQLR